jgi:hypothetical protein
LGLCAHHCGRTKTEIIIIVGDAMVPEMTDAAFLPAAFKQRWMEPDKLRCDHAWRWLRAVRAHDFESLETCKTRVLFASAAICETTNAGTSG